MRVHQQEIFPDEKGMPVVKGYRLHQNLLEKGERPDTRPWAGLFDKQSDIAPAIQHKVNSNND